MVYYDFLQTKLPTELVNHVLSYSYSFQPKVLLEDIRDFHSSLTSIFCHYRSLYLYRLGSQNDGFDKYHLLIHLCGYIFSTYTQSLMYHFFTRSCIKKNIMLEDSDAVKKQIRQVWGMMSVDQRRNFINYRTS
jgi:hypothetical protein